MTIETISTFFERDHREIDALLDGLDYADEGAHERFHEFHMRLERHMHWEEGVLFPAAARKAPQLEAGPIRMMLMEHDLIRESKARALRALRRRDGAQAEQAARSMLGALAGHNMKEEHALYPACDRLFSGAELEALYGELRALTPRRPAGEDR